MGIVSGTSGNQEINGTLELTCEDLSTGIIDFNGPDPLTEKADGDCL